MTETGSHACPYCGGRDIHFTGHGGDWDAWHQCNTCQGVFDVPDSRAGAKRKPRWITEDECTALRDWWADMLAARRVTVLPQASPDPLPHRPLYLHPRPQRARRANGGRYAMRAKGRCE